MGWDDDNDDDGVRYSMHFRYGRLDRTYGLVSYCENSPIISGGDIFNIGVGYSPNDKAIMFSGIVPVWICC